ncbi:SGNH/GDSL hydrolase family protein [Streptomyces sp. NPDC090025]|uniref:SGNH/GDSL hydrolase family protein n=1 Tax=Streptomyces sp. NPDC090025 TaxID=3365922 RepID=UPI003835FD1A
MNLTNTPRGNHGIRRIRNISNIRTTRIGCVAAVAVLGLAACQGGGSGAQDAGTKDVAAGDAAAKGSGTQDGSAQPGTGEPRKLLWMGDSIAEAQAPALGAAIKAGGTEFQSMAAAGGGGVIGEIAAPTWDELPKKLATFKPDVVAYQITTYDWGAAEEQQAGYERLAKTVNDTGAELLLVPAPPFKIDDFYKKNQAAIKSAPASAKAVADKHPETVHYLDAADLWGTDSSAAKAQRSKDGIHSCQQGSAAFANWFGKELNKRYGFTPAPADKWAEGAWTGEKVYNQLGCS